MTKKILMCSFCKRNQNKVKKLIVGPNVYICDFCTNICAEILHEEDTQIVPTQQSHDHTLTPEEIYKRLDEVVAGQEEAKKELSIAAYLHYLRMNEDLKHENNNLPSNVSNTPDMKISQKSKLKKYNMLMIGPTGSGKTLLMQTLAKILNLAYVIVDANSLTETGYVGEDVEGIITKLFNSVYYEGHPNIQECIRQTQYGFIFIDEIDKKYAVDSAMTNRDVSGRGVQQNLLKIIEGTDVQIGNKKNPHQDPITINTGSIFVVGGGAFQGLSQIIRQSMKQSFTLGLMTKEMHSSLSVTPTNPSIQKTELSETKTTTSQDDENLLIKHFSREHLITFGMIPELIGRFSCIAFCKRLTEEQLIEILRDKKDNLIEEYTRIFAIHNVQLQLDHEVLSAIAKKALIENTGARGLRSIVHQLFSSVIFTMPTICNDKNKKFILHVTVDNVNGLKFLQIIEIPTNTKTSNQANNILSQ